MKVSKILFSALSVVLLASAPAFAQEDGNRDANGKIVRGPYETNGFWANWFVSAGGGVDYVLDGIKNGTPHGGVTPAFDVNLGKWFTPEFGARLGYQGIAVKNYDEKLGNNLIHGDLMWNLSNQIWGYKETRVYNLIPYMHAGFFFGKRDDKLRNELQSGVGILNNFRITNALAINVDARLACLRADHLNGTGAAGVLSATAGLTWNIGKNTWKRAVDQTDALNALKEANKALENANKSLADEKDALAADNKKLADDNKKLQDEIDALKKAAAEAVVEDAPFVLFFEIGQSQLNKLELQHLNYYLDNAEKDGNYTLTGSADIATGSQKRNEQLCEQRVNYVVNKLHAAGIKDDQITINDSVLADIPEHPEYGRSVTIER